MIHVDLVFSDRHYGGINILKAELARLPSSLEELNATESQIQTKSRVTQILQEKGQILKVELAGKTYRAQWIVSNATR